MALQTEHVTSLALLDGGASALLYAKVPFLLAQQSCPLHGAVVWLKWDAGCKRTEPQQQYSTIQMRRNVIVCISKQTRTWLFISFQLLLTWTWAWSKSTQPAENAQNLGRPWLGYAAAAGSSPSSWQSLGRQEGGTNGRAEFTLPLSFPDGQGGAISPAFHTGNWALTQAEGSHRSPDPRSPRCLSSFHWAPALLDTIQPASLCISLPIHLRIPFLTFKNRHICDDRQTQNELNIPFNICYWAPNYEEDFFFFFYKGACLINGII